VLREPWGLETLDALASADSHRAAAHVLGLHHSTVQARVSQVEHELGFEVGPPAGRLRLALALRLYQARHVRFPHSGAS
jgi:DNA-binding PucR family transcriptional regulator